MKNKTTPKIIDADRINDGLVVTFNDGKSVLYSAAQLHASATGAVTVVETVKDPKQTA
jgi:hypothetical protein